MSRHGVVSDLARRSSNAAWPAGSPRASRTAATSSNDARSLRTPRRCASASSMRPCRNRRSARRTKASSWRPGATSADMASAAASSRSARSQCPFASEETPVERPALDVQERAAVVGDEPVDHLAPLAGAVEVTGQVAGDQHLAARIDDGDQAGTLAAERAGHRLVDERQPFVHVTLRDKGHPQVPDGHQFEVDVPAVPGEAQGPLLQRLRTGEVTVAGDVGARHPEPALQRARVGSLHHALRPCDPAARRRMVAEVGAVGDAQPHRDGRRADLVGRTTELRVGPLATLDTAAKVAEPPQRLTQAGKRNGPGVSRHPRPAGSGRTRTRPGHLPTGRSPARPGRPRGTRRRSRSASSHRGPHQEPRSGAARAPAAVLGQLPDATGTFVAHPDQYRRPS